MIGTAADKIVDDFVMDTVAEQSEMVLGQSCGEMDRSQERTVGDTAAGSIEAEELGGFVAMQAVAFDKPGLGMKLTEEVDIEFVGAGIGCGTSSCTPVE